MSCLLFLVLEVDEVLNWIHCHYRSVIFLYLWGCCLFFSFGLEFIIWDVVDERDRKVWYGFVSHFHPREIRFQSSIRLKSFSFLKLK